MTDFQSHHENDDELLSAYLDDELSPEERTRVDARLASDPAARQMLDQLRAASLAMQSLPHETVGQDLRESILRRAEAAMLTSHGGQSAAAVTRAAATPATINLRDSLPRITIGQTRRGWVWAALAMAAGLLIMILQPGDQPGDNLPPVAASRSDDGRDKVTATDRADVPELRRWSAPPPPAAVTMEVDHDAFAVAESAPAAATPATDGAAAPSPTSVALDTAAPAATSKSSLSDSAGIVAIDGAVAARAPTGRPGGAVAQSGREGGALAEAPTAAYRRLGDEMKDANASLEAAATNGPARPSVDASGRRMAEVPPQGAVGGEIALGAAATGQTATTDTLAKAPAQASEEDFVVVHVVVKPESLRNKTFDQLLTKNGIQMEEMPEEETAAGLKREMLAERDNVDRKLDRSAEAAQDEDVVLVAAPRTTIESCLSDLYQDQESYLGVSVDASSGKLATAEHKSTVDAEVPAKKLAAELGTRFNRGSVPPQNVEQARRTYFYDFYPRQGQEAAGAAGGRGFGGGGFGGEGERGGPLTQEQELARARVESLGLELKEQLGRGRARRVRSWGFEDQKNRDLQPRRGAVADVRSSTTKSLQFGEVQQKLPAPVQAAGENLHVLFFLSPDTEPPAATPPSPPTENRPK